VVDVTGGVRDGELQGELGGAQLTIEVADAGGAPGPGGP
jgi:hypothetical protein